MQLESAPPETRQSTSPPRSIRRWRRMCASTRSSRSTNEVCPSRYQSGSASHVSSVTVARSSSSAVNGYGVAFPASGTRASGWDPLPPAEGVRDRERVADDEDHLLRPREQLAERLRVPRDDRVAALALLAGNCPRVIRGCPCPVLLEELALVRPVQRVVELRPHEPRHLSSLERDVGRHLRPLELAHDAEVERLVAQRRSEAARLLGPARCQPAGHGDVAVHDIDHVEDALAVAREYRVAHFRKEESGSG